MATESGRGTAWISLWTLHFTASPISSVTQPFTLIDRVRHITDKIWQNAATVSALSYMRYCFYIAFTLWAMSTWFLADRTTTQYDRLLA